MSYSVKTNFITLTNTNSCVFSRCIVAPESAVLVFNRRKNNRYYTWNLKSSIILRFPVEYRESSMVQKLLNSENTCINIFSTEWKYDVFVIFTVLQNRTFLFFKNY